MVLAYGSVAVEVFLSYVVEVTEIRPSKYNFEIESLMAYKQVRNRVHVVSPDVSK